MRELGDILSLFRGVRRIATEGSVFIYLKWTIRHMLRGDSSLGAEMAYWEAELKNHPVGWAQPMHEDVIPAVDSLKNIFQEDIDVLELGPGPRSRLTEGYRKGLFNLTGVDPLADDFKKYLGGEKFLIHGTGETLDMMFPDESFHMCYASNVLDHSKIPLLGFRNLVRLTRIGGLIMVQGNVNEGSRTDWLGLHKFNMWVEDGKLMYSTKDGNPIDLTDGMLLEKVAVRLTLLHGNPWFSITYRRMG